MPKVTYLMKCPNGDFVDLGRNTPREVVKPEHSKYIGGPALHYSGEAAEVMRLLFKYQSRNKK